MALQYLLAPTFQFVNTAGKPLSGGAYMEVYVHGTRTKYFCASDFNGTLHPFRIPLDSLGSNIVLANDTGSYDVYAYNRYGTLMMSRYNVKPGAGGGIGGTITSTDGSIDIHPTEDGVDLSVNGLDPSCLKVSADPRTTDGKFHFDTLVQEGDQAYVDNEGAIRLIKGWYHFTANVQLAWNAGARNETHQVTLYTTLSNSVIDFDISHVHTETIELSGDVSIAEDGSELVIGVSGMPTGLEASVIGMDVHAITGKDGHDKYYAGNGITISNENYIAADFDEVQEKLVAGSGVTIEGNVISAPSLVQVNSDWNATSGVAEILNKPDLDVFATKTEVNTGLASKQNTIPDLAAIRSGARAGASAVQPTDLAAVATTGSYNDLNHRPNLDQYATDQELTASLATKQDTISDLSAIRAGAQAGSTAVQPAALDSYATKVELNTGLSGKQDTINDLSTIRSGAAAGATALQPSDVAAVATTGDYDDLTNKPSIPTATSDLTNDSGFITSADVPVKDVEVDGTSVVNAQGTAEIDLSGYATTQSLTTGLASKQDTISDLATIRSGAAEGATAVQPGDLATVATTGSYDDLADKPTIPAAQVNSDWNSNSGVSQILNKPSLAAVATTGDYDDLVNKPSIPAAQVNSDWNASSGVSEILNKPVLATVATSGSYSDLSNKPDLSVYAESADLATVATTGAYSDLSGTPTIPTATSDLTNDSGFITLSDVPAQVNADWNSSSGVSEILNKPTIPSGTQLVPAATSADADKVLTVNSQGTPAWASAQAPISAGTGIDITNNVVSVDNTVAMKSDLPTVDQTYNASSTNAQSGTAVAGALASYTPTASLATVATTGSYTDLSNTPSIPTATSDLTNDSGFITLSDVPAQVNADWNSSSGASEILNKPTIPSGTQLVPAATSADADKVLTVDSQGTPAWASAQAPISAGNGIDITNNVVSVDTSVVATQTDLADKEDVFNVGTGLEMDTSGATPTLQVEAPVDIVGGPGIVIDNPDGNTLRVSVDQAIETVLYDANSSPNQTGPWTLSEVRTNFEWIDIVFGTDASGNEVKVQRFKADSPYMKVDISRYDDDPSWKISTMTLTFSQATMSIKPNSIARYMITTAGAISVSTAASQAPFIYQVIGIHRIQGGY